MPNLDINISTTADTGGAVQAKTAVENLTHEVKTGTAEHESYREKQHQILEGMHMIALMTGGELREGFHETGLGMRLLGSLTGEMNMGIVGLAAAAGSAIPMIVGYFKEGAAAAAESAQKMQEEIDKNIVKIGKTVGEAKLERLTEMAIDLQDAKTAADQLTQEFPKTMKAEAEFATSALTNAGLLATAQHNIATALGDQVNAVKELEAAEELASKKRELAMLQQIKDQQEVLDEAKKKKARAEADLKLVEDDLVRHKVELDKSRATLIESRARKTELTGEATEVPWSMDLLLDKESYDNYIKSAARQGPSIFDQKGTTRPSGADELKLEAPTLDSRIDNSEEEIKKLSDSIKALERKEKRAETAVGVAEKEIKDDTSAVEINIAKVKDDFISQNIAGKSKEVVDLGKQNAADFKGVLDKVTATTALESGAVGDARKIVADQMITAKELPKAIDDMGRLIGSYQAGFMLMAGNAPENLRQMFEILKNLKDQANQSKTLSIQLKDSVSITSETAAKVRALEYQIKILKEQISH